jgi:hypothetical protein
MIPYQYNDGGRKSARFKGEGGDCVVRAIAIAAELPYSHVWHQINDNNEYLVATSRKKKVMMSKIFTNNSRPENGAFKESYHDYILSLGFEWVPTMAIGTGCKMHLRSGELPMGRLIARVSKHLCAVIDGVLHDNHDSSRNGKRCVYGYYIKTATPTEGK